MQAGVTDDLQQHSRLISSKVCHISLGSHLAHCRLKFKPVAKKKTHSVWKPNPCLCGLSGQREQTTVPLSVNRGRWFTERYRLLLRSCKIKCPLDTCQGVRFMPRGNKRAPNASLFYSRLGQPDLILKANFWKRRLRNKTMQFFFFLHLSLSFLLSPHIMGLTYKVKEVEKLTVLLQCTPGTEPHSMEGYGSGDIYKNIRKGRNTTATSQSQFFPPLRIVMVRCRILHQHLCQKRHHI